MAAWRTPNEQQRIRFGRQHPRGQASEGDVRSVRPCRAPCCTGGTGCFPVAGTRFARSCVGWSSETVWWRRMGWQTVVAQSASKAGTMRGKQSRQSRSAVELTAVLREPSQGILRIRSGHSGHCTHHAQMCQNAMYTPAPGMSRSDGRRPRYRTRWSGSSAPGAATSVGIPGTRPKFERG